MFRDQERYGNDPTKVRQTAPATFRAPLKWQEPKRIFTCSWSDFFIEEADAWRPEAWEIIRQSPHHTYQILTKRPERILANLPSDWGNGYPNVWIGVTVEDQAAADKRIPLLLQVPAAVRFLSCEPLLGSVDLGLIGTCPKDWGLGYSPVGSHLHWVIAGGESGPNARPMHPDWARTLRDQCQAAGVAFFFKQWGEWAPGGDFEFIPASVSHDFDGSVQGDDAQVWRVGKKAAGRELDGRTWDEMPEVGHG